MDRHGAPSRLAIMLVGVVAFTITIAAASSWTGPGGPSAFGALIGELADGGPWVAIWLLMAYGIGWPLRCALAPTATAPRAAQLGLGILGALTLVTVIGSVGWSVGWTARTIAVALLGGGALAGVVSLMRTHRVTQFRDGTTKTHGMFRAGPMVGVLVAMPAVAALIVAACATPGWLWATEFGGYDALSYHLQMPREWMALGRIVPMEHCVYAAMPNAIEAAFLHLMIARGDADSSAVACQLLHASLALCTALITGSAARGWATMRDRSGAAWLSPHLAGIAAALAAAMVLVTPWTVVVGSLAYSELGTTVAFATGLLLLTDRAATPARHGAAIGLCASVACAAKLSAVGMVALPLVLLLLVRVRPRHWAVALSAGAVVGLLVLSPWLIRNAIVCGSPTFPLLAALFGPGWWDAEQIRIFATAHLGSGDGAASSLYRVWTQWLAFGFGPSPESGEPWRTQWALTPWLGLLGLIPLLARRRWDLAALAIAGLLVPLLFWITATHLQSRFLVPTVVPLAILAAVGGASLARRDPTADAASVAPNRMRAWTALALVVTAALSLWPVVLLRTEAGGASAAAIGARHEFAGAPFLDEWQSMKGTRRERDVLAEAGPPFWINRALGPESTVLLVGDATPWHLGKPIAPTRDGGAEPARFRWQTVWDRGPLSRAIAAAPDDPESWRASLRAAGYTHLVVNMAMLDRWRRSGWLDPQLTQERLDALIGTPARVRAVTRQGVVLVELREP